MQQHIVTDLEGRTWEIMSETSHLQSLFAHVPKANRVLGDDKRIPKGKGKLAPNIYLLASIQSIAV